MYVHHWTELGKRGTRGRGGVRTYANRKISDTPTLDERRGQEFFLPVGEDGQIIFLVFFFLPAAVSRLSIRTLDTHVQQMESYKARSLDELQTDPHNHGSG